MPIIGLTDQNRAHATFPRLGQLRKGGKKESDRKPGPDLTFFRFVTDDDDAMRAFTATYGQEPRVINVFLPFASPAENLDTWMEEHVAGGLKHRCDGKTMVVWQDEGGMFHTDPKPCPYVHLPRGSKERKCKESLELRVLIPELGRLSIVNVVSTSKWDCIEITNNLAAVEDIAHKASIITGRTIDLRGIPLLLVRAPRMISTPSGEDGKRARREKWLVHLEINPAWVQTMMSSIKRFSMPVDLLQLAAPNTDDIEAEFDDDGEEDEVVETVAQPESAAAATAANGNGAGRRAKLAARIHELADDIAALGGDFIHIDQAWLDTADEGEITDYGKRLRAEADTLKAAKATQSELQF